MNNKNKILIGCLALLLVMSIGYALFSDTITINGTATAKGNFSLTTTCDMNQDAINEALGSSSNGVAEKGSVTDANIICEGNVVNASVTLGYPGSSKWFRVMVENTGSIPAKMKRVFELSNPDFVNTIDSAGNASIYKCSGNSLNMVCADLYSDYSVFDDYSTLPVGYTAEYPGTHTEEFEAILDPGEIAYYYIRFLWIESSTTPGEPLPANLKVQMDWQQVTS